MRRNPFGLGLLALYLVALAALAYVLFGLFARIIPHIA